MYKMQEEDLEEIQQRQPVLTNVQLCLAFKPIVLKLLDQHPASLPFRQPVDPVALKIPDYFEKIKRPMDLSTINWKLDNGQYQEPWQYIDDVWLMFDNAWTYNKEQCIVYKFCSRLAELFKLEIQPVMRSLGYCCGQRYLFQPQVLCCIGKVLCSIPRGAMYWSYEDKYIYCEKCFEGIPGDTVTLGSNPTEPQTIISKDQFKKMKNDNREPELFVECSDCGCKLHKICCLHIPSVCPDRYTCDNCLEAKNRKRMKNKFTAKRLQQTRLGTYIENRVNNYLKKEDCGAHEVTIRVVSCFNKSLEVKPGMRARYVDTGDWPEQFPYRAKTLFAFQEIDGVDICFFGMHVQEYGSDCAMPNTRHVYIAYIDILDYFTPKEYAEAVHHEILLGYLEYVKHLGYTMAHIWACPPTEGDDCIFYCHPQGGEISESSSFQDWCKKMLHKGILEKTIVDYKNIEEATKDCLQSASELPYFEGDFWPNVLEESIKELNQEEEKHIIETAVLDHEEIVEQENFHDKEKGQKCDGEEKSNNCEGKLRKCMKTIVSTGENGLLEKVKTKMNNHKEEFFVIKLHSAQAATSLPQIYDPDPVITCDMMDGPNPFLTLAREKHYEFSSLRRAKYSSMTMLYMMHNQGQEYMIYTCNKCKKTVENICYQCTVCEEFYLCASCHETESHPHAMEELDLEDGSVAFDENETLESDRQFIQLHLQSVDPADLCCSTNCGSPLCMETKRVIQHVQSCEQQANSCTICKRFIALFHYHAKHCQEEYCPIPFCACIKHKLIEQWIQQRQGLRRRLAAIQNSGMSS